MVTDIYFVIGFDAREFSIGC